jgi:cellulose synthase/poly-beta-1,6-N-acetylglucosamine synthase-like glycosyltransferase
MSFRFTRRGLTGSERRWQRAFEILPGALSWSVLIGLTWLSIRAPRLAAVLIIAFDLYWLFRMAYTMLFLTLSYARLSAEQTTDWMARIARLPQAQRHGAPPLEEIHHVVMFPIAKERRAVYEPGIESLLRQQFPARQILVVLAVESRSPEIVRQEAQAVRERYGGAFGGFLVVTHPDGLPGEARVKGANATYAAKAAAEELTRRRIPFERVVMSCFDADTVVNPQYLGCLTFHFMACPQRTRASFQPIPVYHNNIWEVPGFARVLELGSSFFQLAEATNPNTLVTFSSHSMSFRALVDVGYWPVDMISDDSAIFWKALIHYTGDYRVVPMYTTVSMDVAASSSWRRSVVNVYRQKRRWAWGVENLPIVFRAFRRGVGPPFLRRCAHGVKLLEGHLSWATWPFLLGVIGWLPALLAGQEFSNSVVYYTAPRIAGTIFGLASVGLLTTIVLSLLLLPKPGARHPWLRRAAHTFEWALIPVIAICFSALPALDAQTRLMLNRRLEFWVSEKHRRR